MAVVVTLIILSFLAGFGFELSYLVWLYLADLGKPGLSAMMSMVVGIFSLGGMGLAITHSGATAYALIAGYGAGSYVAAHWKRYQDRVQRETAVREVLQYRPPPIVIEN